MAIRRIAGEHVLLWVCLTAIAAAPSGWAAPSATSTTLTMSSGGNAVTNVNAGTVVTLTATVMAGDSALTAGQVEFCDSPAAHCTDIHLVGIAQMTSAGAAILRFRPSIGTHNLYVAFSGTANDAPSSSSVSQLSVTGEYGSVTTLTASGFAGSYQMAATVGGYAGTGVAFPSGSISVVDTSQGNKALGSAALTPLSTGPGWINPWNAPAGIGTSPVVTADFNGDGIPDLAVLNANAQKITILLGKGDGTFKAVATAPQAGSYPIAMVGADFNSDGKADLAILDSGTDTIEILLGNGDGTFTAAASPSAGASANSMAVGDFNRDGSPDLVVVNACSVEPVCTKPGGLTILLGNGNGTFKTSTSSPSVDGYSEEVAVADLNGDGNLDLAVVTPEYAYPNYAGVQILLGKGDGTFAASYTVWAGNYPVALAIGDFNGDGVDDLAVSGGGTSGQETILIGNGSGGFTAAANPPALSAPGKVAVGDFNGDGNLDVVVDTDSGTAVVLLGNGAGSLIPAALSPAPGSGWGFVAADDLNGDGISDLVITDSLAASVTVLLTEPQISRAVVPTVSPIGVGTHIAAASYAGDTNYAASQSSPVGLVELPPATTTALTLTSGTTAVSSVSAGTAITLTARVKSGASAVTRGEVNFCDATARACSDIHLLGTAHLSASGTAALKLIPAAGTHRYSAVFQETDSNTTSSSAIVALTVTAKFGTLTSLAEQGVPGNYTLTATVNGDAYEPSLIGPTGTVSFIDTSAGNAVLKTGKLAHGAAALSWQPISSSFSATGSANTIATADFNGDGIPDLALTTAVNDSTDGFVEILLGNGDGTYALKATLGAGLAPWGVAVADFNGDGVPDLAVTNSQGSTMSVYLGNGDGSFRAASPPLPTGELAYWVVAADFNGDGVPDLAVANYLSDSVWVYFGNGDGTFSPVPSVLPTGHYPASLVEADFNDDGKADLAVLNTGDSTVTILLGNGDGTFKAGPQTPSVNQYSLFMATADFNDDGRADLVINGNDSFTVLLGNGNGTFKNAPATTISPTNRIVIGDFNGDGRVDLAVPTNAGSAITILLSKGDGTFKAVPGPATIAWPFVAGNFGNSGLSGIAGVTSVGNGEITVTDFLTTVDESATAIVTGVTPAGAGPHNVVASYGGSGSFAPSISNGLTLFRQPPSTTTTLQVTNSAGVAVKSIAAGNVVTLTATVKDYGANVQVGQVKFCDATVKECSDIHLLGAAQLTGTGKAAMKFVPGPGVHSYKAVFQGTTSDLASASAAEALTVTGKLQARATLAQSGGPGTYTLTATVMASAGKQAKDALSGSVSFLDTSNGNLKLGSAVLVTTIAPGWVNSQSPRAGDSPFTAAAADFNGDGIPDVDVADANDTNVTVFLGKGDGTFTPVLTPDAGAGNYANFIAAADLNGDGIEDLVFVPSGNDDGTLSSLTILIGDGDGTFTLMRGPTVGPDPQMMAIGDFNRDGIPDLAVTNNYSDNVTILLGRGDGTFTTVKTSPVVGKSPYAIATGDFNGDGKADLAVTNIENQVVILMGNGDGTFKAGTNFPTGSAPAYIAVADLNGDGFADLAIANAHSGDLTILLGNGHGGFTASATNPVTQSSPSSIVVGDFNGDGKPDLAVSCVYAPTITVLIGNGNGTFAAAPGPAAGSNPIALVSADFNGDGIPDLAAANFTSDSVSVLLADSTVATATVSGIAPVGLDLNEVMAAYPGDANHQAATSAAIGLGIPVARPVFSVGAGTYTTAQKVKITDAKTGASIYYTLDGTMPTSKSTGYTGTITIAKSETLTAVAALKGSSPSAPAQAAYTIFTPTSGPMIRSVSAVSDQLSQTITITGSGFGTHAAYTGNSEAIKITKLNFEPWSAGFANGKELDLIQLVVKSWTNTNIVLGGFAGDIDNAPFSDYTLANGDLLSFNVWNAQTLAGPGTCTNIIVGAGATKCTLALTATPVIAPQGGAYVAPQTVTITDATPNATIYYTTDGTTPTTNSPVYSAPQSTVTPIYVSSSTTVQAIATTSGSSTSAPTGYSASAPAIVAYTIGSVTATPVFSVSPGSYSSPQRVVISDATPGAILYFTTDGSLPTLNSPVYSGAIEVTVSSSETLQAIAVANGYAGSALASASYVIAGQAAVDQSNSVQPRK